MTGSLDNDIGDDISERLQAIQQRVAQAKQPVRLIAVSKTFPAVMVQAAYDAGIRDFAENKVQEGISKQSQLSNLTDVTWHFIGHVQSNKSRKVVESFDWIHSVDSLKLATRMNRQAQELGRCPLCCLQVKLAEDANKTGFDRDELMAALPELDLLEQLKIVGLMVIPPYGLPPAQTKAIFAAGRLLAQEIRAQGWNNIRMDELSMGMSRDFEWAIAAGSTAIRIGSGLFGQRG